MQFCQKHWAALRAAVISRGMGDFISKDGPEVIQREMAALKGAPATLENVDPLMGVHWMIVNRAFEVVGQIGGNPLVMMTKQPDHPELECPLCYLNWISLEHDRLCTEPDCQKPKGMTFDEWIDGAAEEMKEQMIKLGKLTPPKDENQSQISE